MDQPISEYRKAKTKERQYAGPVLTPVQSRQGVMTGHIRWILAISVTLAVIALVVLYAMYV